MKAKFFILFLLVTIQISLKGQDNLPLKVIVGGDYNYPPYEYLNEQSLPDGYNVDLTNAICKQLNWQPSYKLAKWDLVRHWLDTEDIDLIQGMAFSIERAKIMYFSDSHTQTWRSIFVRKNSSIRDPKGILNATVVIQKGDIATEYLKRINFDGITIEVPTQDDAIKLLDSGEYDAAILNHMSGMHIIEQDKLKNVIALPHRIFQKEYCYASKNQKLINEIDGALLALNRSGQMTVIQEKWFGKLDSSKATLSYFQRKISTLVLVILLILLGSTICLAYYMLKYRKRLNNELFKRESIEKELHQEYQIFVRGPVIIYKMQQNPDRVLMISENIDQWGYNVDEILALEEGFQPLILSEDKQQYIAQCKDEKQAEYCIKRYRIRTKNGEIRWVIDYSTTLISPSLGTLAYGYLMDVSSQKNLEAQLLDSKEKAEAASNAKSYFLANMSHEIRTPLNGIMGFVQVLLQMKASDEQREFYQIMYSSGKSLMKIINDILDFSKIESGKMELIINAFNPRMLIEDVLKTYRVQNKNPDLEIRHVINERIPDILYGDQLRFKQIIVNLLQNAVKFTESGFVEFNADIYTVNDSLIRLLFCVSDTGIGIDHNKQQEIFDDFNQADANITGKYGGTGLGLSIVKRLVQLMNGFIWVESEPGKGSSFYFILPFEVTHEHAQIPSGESTLSEKGRSSLLGMRVLLVEDEPINQVVTRRQLESWKIEVTLAANGKEALEKCSVNKYDAILMDIQMPVMDGITATQTLRLQEIPKNMHTPIIAFTAAALVGDRERFLEHGMDDYIAKPIELNQLHRILAKYWHRS